MTNGARKSEGRAWGLRAAFRVLVVLLLTAAALHLMNAILPGFRIDGDGTALLAAALIGLVNALVWPILIRVALPFTVLTLGLGVLVLNGGVVLLVAQLEPSMHVRDLGTGIAVAIGVTIVNTLTTSLLAIDDDDFYYRNVLKRAARRHGVALDSAVPGVYFLEIDGLAHDVMRRALRDGHLPTLARWVAEGTHSLFPWETDWSSQTGACQAGLLHGSNDDMPAFRWWEKESGRAMVTNHPKDAAEIERRHSDGRGLLHDDGASRANILSGDAPHTLLTMSTVLERGRPGRLGEDYYAYFSNPYSVTRTVALVIADIAHELFYAAQQRRRDIRPRIKRTFSYALVRAWGTVIQRDLQVAAVIGDLYAGRPVGYTTFLAYDEVAHHSGVERVDALAVLRRLDRQLSRIEAAARDATRPYHLVVLSDHGQSQGATFRDRYGITLEDLVTEACAARQVDAEEAHSDESLSYLSASLTEASGGRGLVGRAARAVSRKSAEDGEVVLGEEGTSERERQAAGESLPPELSVMASGCLGLISFPRERGRVSLERIERRYPSLMPALLDHPGIGFALVRSERDGAIALGREGSHRLSDGSVTGKDPLASFGPNAAGHLRRTDSFEHCPDIVVNSTYWEETDEVAAFEELVGSHGGMGGEQSHPFALAPATWEMPAEPVVGAEEMHRLMRRWLVALGQSSYEAGSEPPTAAHVAEREPTGKVT
ncbi:MAG: phage holin family protein [Actinomycetota bacterium]|nr:phage holin family protein [Actinomycetota bacterium]